MQFAAEKVIPVTLIPGDGIGPEIVEASVMVLDALHAPFAWDVHQAGMSGLEAFGDPLPQTTVDSIRRTRLALKGPLTTPAGDGYRSSTVRLREEFHLYANVRPARTLAPGGRVFLLGLDRESKHLLGRKIFERFDHVPYIYPSSRKCRGAADGGNFFPLLRSPCDFQAGKKFSFPQKKRIRVR